VLVYKDGGQPGNFHPHISLVGDGFPFSKMVINSHVYRLRTTDRITQDFLYYHLSSDESLNWMRRNGTGSAIPGLARKELLRLPIILPPPTLIRQFDGFASPLNSMILVIARLIKNLITTRDLMLPKLISGEVSVEQCEAVAVAQTV
jgi:type I restriction enzyme S subunit